MASVTVVNGCIGVPLCFPLHGRKLSSQAHCMHLSIQVDEVRKTSPVPRYGSFFHNSRLVGLSGANQSVSVSRGVLRFPQRPLRIDWPHNSPRLPSSGAPADAYEAGEQ